VEATGKKFPPGWDEDSLQRLIAHYEQQSEDEQVAEDEAAQEAPGTPDGRAAE
jgi:hypothetical protein